ncbi:hypothetical protein JHK82_014802 [Glycine max]|uniref:Uncharacterized protein n=2 Tax=Glycine subgen. Soja TaxID=1462606 RepID=A0A0R0JJG6_SOYBN|nr:hypothetical protein JHK87_014720 [Glycine soja]KAG5031187.1 hypothetical protein JHK85_015169 [Glycine max]KAG5045412.1 hypothetical protein JHK86_014818 [Glycine max]KAG5147921.1 hypothetical protein JHK82_014802 [Glycine max]KAH1124967.1 hypothetical protein GYH30_014559 [Glycine max]
MYFYLSAEVTRVQTPAVMGTTASYHIRLLSLNHVLRVIMLQTKLSFAICP